MGYPFKSGRSSLQDDPNGGTKTSTPPQSIHMLLDD